MGLEVLGFARDGVPEFLTESFYPGLVPLLGGPHSSYLLLYVLIRLHTFPYPERF